MLLVMPFGGPISLNVLEDDCDFCQPSAQMELVTGLPGLFQMHGLCVYSFWKCTQPEKVWFAIWLLVLSDLAALNKVTTYSQQWEKDSGLQFLFSFQDSSTCPFSLRKWKVTAHLKMQTKPFYWFVCIGGITIIASNDIIGVNRCNDVINMCDCDI